uniref:Uncharacterized protein n=1 Tax=Rhizophora mucronata TaxID=61149 RepID=A0A2P2PEZ8_RHIMU
MALLLSPRRTKHEGHVANTSQNCEIKL